MARMIDEMLGKSGGLWITPDYIGKTPQSILFSGLRQAEVVVINNVAEYVQRDERDAWDMADFPNIAPVFEVGYYEYDIPRLTGKTGVEINSRFRRVGILQFAFDLEDEILVNMLEGGREKEYLRQRMTRKVGAEFGTYRWATQSLVFAEMYVGGRWRIVGPLWEMNYAAHGDGTAAGALWVSQLAQDAHMTNESLDAYRAIGVYLFSPLLMALSFLHCKNVALRENAPAEHVIRRAAKQRQKPPITYKTLDILPMRQRIESVQESQETGIKTALHIMRGHFKDYKDGRGLFGKYHGLYYWNQTTRGGNPSRRIEKVYDVHATEDKAI